MAGVRVSVLTLAPLLRLLLLIHPGCNKHGPGSEPEERAAAIKSCSIYYGTLNYERKHPDRTDVA